MKLNVKIGNAITSTHDVIIIGIVQTEKMKWVVPRRHCVPVELFSVFHH